MVMKNWELRRVVMGWDTDPDLRLGMIICIDHFDWNTMYRVFESKHAYYQWLWGLAKRYNFDPRVMRDGMKVLQEAGAIEALKAGVDVRVMTLTEPTNTEAALEAYRIRKEEKEQDNE